MSLQKKCSGCGIVKDLFLFPKDSYRKDFHYHLCKECCARRSREYARKHPEKVKKSQKKWRVENPDTYHKTINKWHKENHNWSKEWHKNNPHKRYEYYRNYQANKKGSGGKITSEEWVDLCEKYGNMCLCCKKKGVKLTLDHIVPISVGGENTIENSQPLCRVCNSKKHTKTIDYRPF